jgi:hypothetical protein
MVDVWLRLLRSLTPKVRPCTYFGFRPRLLAGSVFLVPRTRARIHRSRTTAFAALTAAIAILVAAPGTANAANPPDGSATAGSGNGAPVAAQRAAAPAAAASCTNTTATCIPDGSYSVPFFTSGTAICAFQATINWGDGQTQSVSFQSGSPPTVTHKYPADTPKVYTVSITGSASPISPPNATCTFTPTPTSSRCRARPCPQLYRATATACPAAAPS